MATYKDSGVDILAGDASSALAYAHAMSTFPGRKGKIGSAVMEEDGFAGIIDMRDYFLVQSDDSTGSKIDIAFEAGRYDGLGYDLLCMVADDAVCMGAEVISVTNTLDVPKVDPAVIDALLAGHARACREQNVIIAGGEIAEVPGAVTHAVWSATIVGIVEKRKIIRGEHIKAGQSIVALRSRVARSNGFSLIRHVLAGAFGENWHQKEWSAGVSWGEIVLTPSLIYHGAILDLIGRFEEERSVDVKGIAHITGGGIPSKLGRILKKSGLGAALTDLWPPHQALQDLVRLGNVATEEAYRTWNMGNGMLLVIDPEDEAKTIAMLATRGIEARHAGIITKDPTIALTAWNGETLNLNPKK